MKRWLSLIKKHVTPGVWAKPAKKRRPLTIMTQVVTTTESRPTSRPMPSDYYVTAPLVPLRHPQPSRAPLCDVDLIIERYAGWRTPTPLLYHGPIARPDSQALPLADLTISPQAFVDHSFIHFEPTYRVTVSEVAPHQLVLRKPRFERMRKVVSFIPGVYDGKIRIGAAVHFEE